MLISELVSRREQAMKTAGIGTRNPYAALRSVPSLWNGSREQLLLNDTGRKNKKNSGRKRRALLVGWIENNPAFLSRQAAVGFFRRDRLETPNGAGPSSEGQQRPLFVSVTATGMRISESPGRDRPP